jgi:TonB family protein
MPRDDLISSFQIGRIPSSSPSDARPEPRFGAMPLQVDFDEARRLELARATAQPPAPSQLRGRTLPFGMIGALAVHLSPLLLLLSWTGAPAEIVQPIPIELVLEPPPPPEPKSEQKAEKPPPPPLGRFASVDMGEPVQESEPPASSPDQHPSEPTETQVAAARPPPPELVSALPKPVSPPEPLAEAPALPEPPPPKPALKPVVATPHPPKPRPARPHAIPGPDATRDEYLAYIASLINQHSNLLAPSVIAGRRGVAVISILVLGDGTIARIAVKRGSGYPDIDARIEQMIATVRRFPPLPQWIQGPSVLLDYHRVFPDRFGKD